MRRTVELLAQSGTGTDGAGLIGFLIVGGLFLFCWFLYRSMSRHLRRVDFEERPAPSPPPPEPDPPA